MEIPDKQSDQVAEESYSSVADEIQNIEQMFKNADYS